MYITLIVKKSLILSEYNFGKFSPYLCGRSCKQLIKSLNIIHVLFISIDNMIVFCIMFYLFLTYFLDTSFLF